MRSGGGPGRAHDGPHEERVAPPATGPSLPVRDGRRRHLPGPDARRARGDHTRRALLDALIDLLDEGTDHPTVPEVAVRAGVSVRIVYHHYGSVQRLLEATVAHQSARHRHLLFPIPPRGQADIRIRALCRQRRMFFEAVTPVLRLADRRSPGTAGAGGLPVADRALLRDQLARTLAPELSARGGGADDVLDALEHATSWETWRGLRDVGGHTAPSAERVMVRTVNGLLT